MDPGVLAVSCIFLALVLVVWPLVWYWYYRGALLHVLLMWFLAAMPVGLFTTYLWSTADAGAAPWLLTISRYGSVMPASTMLTLALTSGAWVLFSIRFELSRTIYSSVPFVPIYHALALLSTYGLTLAGAYQVSLEPSTPHDVGAAVFVIASAVYETLCVAHADVRSHTRGRRPVSVYLRIGLVVLLDASVIVAGVLLGTGAGPPTPPFLGDGSTVWTVGAAFEWFYAIVLWCLYATRLTHDVHELTVDVRRNDGTRDLGTQAEFRLRSKIE